MTSPFSRLAPFPYDALLDPGDGSGPVGLMLVPDQEGLLVARSEESLANVAPTEYGYASQDPLTETTFTFGRLTGGMGESTQTTGAARRYRDALDVDCSIGGMPRLGPAFTVQTLPAALAGATDVRQLIVGPGPTSTDLLYALRGRGVYVNTAGVWTLSRDFTGINYPTQAAVFQGTAGSRYLLVTTVTGQLWAFDGTTWNASPFAAGEIAATVAVVGNEVYVGANNELRVATGNVLAPGVFGGIIRVGHAGTRITWLQAVGDEMVVFKSDGVYTLTTTGDGVEDNDLFPELRPQAAATNGVNAVAWSDALWFGYGDAYYRMTSGGDLTPIGPERLVDNTSTVRGVPVGGTPHADWFLYLLVYNADVSTTFLFKYGTWANTDQTSGFEFLDAWHGAVAHWVGKVGTRADVVYPGGVPTLYVGFADGSIEATVLPTGTPDPASDDACRFISQGDLYMPLHTADYPATVKSFHAVAGVGPALSASLTATVYYRPTPVSAYQSIGTAFTTSGQRVTFPLPQTGVVLDTFTRLATTTDTLTPVLEHVALFEAIRPHSPTLRLGWTLTARAADRVPRRDGVVSPVPAARVRAALRTAQQAPGRVVVRLPDETINNLEAISYHEVLAPNERRVGLDHAIALRLTAVI
jgi:hypothetical protein